MLLAKVLHAEANREKKTNFTTPFGVNLIKSQLLHRAAQVHAEPKRAACHA